MKNKPVYSIGSVDSALLLATLLQHEEPMRVTDAAERLQSDARVRESPPGVAGPSSRTRSLVVGS